MVLAVESASERKPRIDAERNRVKLVEAATVAFTEKGAAASLEEIARQAGVGIGTLYRHFPTRAALMTEVYRARLGQLSAAVDELAAAHPPVEALRQWLFLFVDYLADKKIVADAMTAIVGDTTELYAGSTAILLAALKRLTARAEASGDIRLASDPLDLLRAIAAIASATPGPVGVTGARQMAEILVAGLRAR